MRKIVSKKYLILFSLILFFFFCCSIKAEEDKNSCSYTTGNGHNFSIVYSEDGQKYEVESEKEAFNKSYFENIPSIFNYLFDFESGAEVYVEQGAFGVGDDVGKKCPTKFNVCVLSSGSFSADGLKSLLKIIKNLWLYKRFDAELFSKTNKVYLYTNTYEDRLEDEDLRYIIKRAKEKGISKNGTWYTAAYIYMQLYNSDKGTWFEAVGANVDFSNVAAILKTISDIGTITHRLENLYCSEAIYTGSKDIFNANCAWIDNLTEKYDAAVENYKDCSDNANCKILKKQTIKEIESNMKDQCKVLLANLNYDDLQKDCINVCLRLKDALNEKLKGTDLYVDENGKGNVNTCGFSERLFAIVDNVISWVKYIVPVLVILLGIIDFIRAVVTDKDDGMKQAQSRFIKRLIAAALIFVVPLILSFILKKMGFVVEDCGIKGFGL